MAAHGIGIAITLNVLVVIIYIGYKYITAREKAAALDMEDIFGRYNPKKGIVEDVSDNLIDNGFSFDVEGNEWPIVGMTRVRGAPGPPSLAKNKQAVKRFKQI